MKRQTKDYLLLLFWLGLIYFFSSIPNLESGLEYDTFLRKLAHMVEFGILFFLSYKVIGAIPYAILFSYTYAVSDEFHQSFVFGRSGRFTDTMIDAFGILLTAGLLIYLARRKKQLSLKNG